MSKDFLTSDVIGPALKNSCILTIIETFSNQRGLSHAHIQDATSHLWPRVIWKIMRKLIFKIKIYIAIFQAVQNPTLECRDLKFIWKLMLELRSLVAHLKTAIRLSMKRETWKLIWGFIPVRSHIIVMFLCKFLYLIPLRCLQSFSTQGHLNDHMRKFHDSDYIGPLDDEDTS